MRREEERGAGAGQGLALREKLRVQKRGREAVQSKGQMAFFLRCAAESGVGVAQLGAELVKNLGLVFLSPR